MKEEDLVREMLQARVKYYRTITYVLLGLVSLCVVTLAGTIYFPTHTEREVITLFISLTSGLFGSLLTIITQGIQAARRLRSDEELQQVAEEVEAAKTKRLQQQRKDISHVSPSNTPTNRHS